MKKILKSRIFLVIITIILTLGTTVCGAILYNANQVSYAPSDTTWNVSNVDEALNDLYSTANTKFTNFRSVVAQAITNKGVATSATASVETMASNIGTLATNKYNEGYSAGKSNGGILKKTYLAHYNHTASIVDGQNWSFTYNASGISGYKDLTADNFMLDNFIFGVASHASNDAHYSATATKSYNATTGILTYSTMVVKNGWNTGGIEQCDLYLIRVENN